MRIFLNILKSTVKYMKSKFLLIYGFKIPEIIKDKKKESEPIIEPKERFVNIEVEKLIDRLNSFKPVEETSKNPHEKELGEPDLIQKFEEDGYSYEKSIWYVDGGTVVKVRVISTPYDSEDPDELDRLNLEQKLKMAINDERYEEAALIRDELNELNESISGKTSDT
tara:strand:+ start:5016 stop:5516 length:501 start_codon:yes stop_codon:yes gene_type:complete